MGPGVLVLGMHRSGTSAVAHLLEALGLRLCAGEDRVTGDAANPAGYFQSQTVVAGNDLLLAAAGARWWCPPARRDWTVELSGQPVARALQDAFVAAHPTGPWACKDPRLCLTADLWWRALEIPRIAVLVLRNPLEVARSVQRWHRFSVPYGLALCERYLRAAARRCEGAAVYVGEYERLVADPLTWCACLARFLASAGMAPLDDGAPASAARLVRPDLHREVASDRALDESGIVSDRLRGLYRALRDRRGAHRCWEGPPLGPEPATLEALFEAARRSPGFGEPRELLLDDGAATAPVERLRVVLAGPR